MMNDIKTKMYRRILVAMVGFLGVVVVAGFGRPAISAPHEIAVLQGLDKVTARVFTLQAPIGAVVRFGTLEIIVRRCDKRPPEETPESAAFVDIWKSVV